MLKIEDMGLSPLAQAAAQRLLAAHPIVQFTSGRRDLLGQAHAMACNVALRRDWIRLTYLHAADLQTWVDQHPEAVSIDQLTAGLYATMQAMDEGEVAAISHHLTGDAFDVLPLLTLNGEPTEEGQAVLDTIHTLPGLDKFLAKEGGLIRWHAQFVPSATV